MSRTRSSRDTNVAVERRRTPNAFLFYRSSLIQGGFFPKGTGQSEVSRECGKMWKMLSPEDQSIFFQKAEEERLNGPPPGSRSVKKRSRKKAKERSTRNRVRHEVILDMSPQSSGTSVPSPSFPITPVFDLAHLHISTGIPDTPVLDRGHTVICSPIPIFPEYALPGWVTPNPNIGPVPVPDVPFRARGPPPSTSPQEDFYKILIQNQMNEYSDPLYAPVLNNSNSKKKLTHSQSESKPGSSYDSMSKINHKPKPALGITMTFLADTTLWLEKAHDAFSYLSSEEQEEKFICGCLNNEYTVEILRSRTWFVPPKWAFMIGDNGVIT
ncbi:hypothetical protein PNOK_0774100 [Pyrrhoderma noxium]|uniref:HMG box domain-containing protein n=1 Tax=Pyrrhoderma noxium TaxID=2282107 RepID=A0A286U955_9AGAM|nr:hypothetical protein PNOK_0774100 [Pyrrhoderma noxium]